MALRVPQALWKCFQVVLVLVLVVEGFSFLAMMIHNYMLYGHVFSHVPVRYDPDALFVMTDRNPPCRFNSASEDPRMNRTVWMFGGSTVRCNAHRDENTTLPAFLSKFLNERGRPYHFTVANLGENGFNSVLESKYLQKALVESSAPPHIVIFYDGANDAFQFAEYRQPVGHIGYRRLKAFIESYRMTWYGIFKPISAAIHASYTNEFLDRIRMFHVPVKSDSPELAEMVDLAVRRYDHVARVVTGYGAEFVLIWQPILWVENCETQQSVRQAESSLFVDIEKFPNLKQGVRTTYDALERALQNKPYFVSFRDVLCKRTTALFWPDGIHLNSPGNEIVAENIGQLLMRGFPGKASELSVGRTTGGP